MRGLALEGGGARGAYHMGVVKALYENGYEFDGFVGTSIGAVNAAILAQGDFEIALELWTNMSMDLIFDEDEQHLLQLMNPTGRKLDAGLPVNVKKAVSKIIGERGVSTARMKEFLGQYLDEEKIRASGKDFGLVTVSVSDRKPLELMLEDIPQGQLVNYVMASASFPGFRPETIDEKVFLDGGLYNNCPVNLLSSKGYDEIIAVRTRAPGLVRHLESSDAIKTIAAREDLGNILLFTRENCATGIRLGYYDGLRFVKELRGVSYYITPVAADDFGKRLMSLEEDVILEIAKNLNIPETQPKRMLFERIIPQLGAYLKLRADFDYADFVIGLLETDAKAKGIERFKLYDFEELCALTQTAQAPEQERGLLKKLPINSLLARKKTAVELLCKHLLH